MTDQTVNWEALHQLMEQTRQRIVMENTLTPELEQQILHARAERLSKSSLIETNQKTVHMLSFMLGKENYGVELEYVTMVSKITNLTPLPGVPAFIAGMIQIHGNILCALSLTEMIDLEKTASTDASRVIVVEHSKMQVGLIVDAITDIQVVPIDAIQTSLPALTGKRSEYLKGVTQQQLILLNVPMLLSGQHLIVNQDV